MSDTLTTANCPRTSNRSYAALQSAAGDTQFITDTYNNLLHRAPGRGDAAWYLAHAALLTDFSQSAKFLGDVQITSAHPADSQHWLLLI